MRAPVGTAALAVLALAAVVFPATTAARISGDYTFNGIELEDGPGVTGDRRPFIGDTEGTRGDKGPWLAVLRYGELEKTTRIRGGTFRMAATPRGGERDDLWATVSSGTIRLARDPRGCADRVYTVRGTLTEVRTRTVRAGRATFTGTLTEHRGSSRPGGRCFSFVFSLRGAVHLPF